MPLLRLKLFLGRTDEVDTSELLERLQQASGDETLAQSTLEALNVGRLSKAHLVEMVGLDLVELLHNSNVVDGKTAQFGQRLGGFIVAVGLDEVTRGLGEEEKTAPVSVRW